MSLFPHPLDQAKTTFFAQGAITMRDLIVSRMTWHAESAPSKETADYLWQIIMDTKELGVPPRHGE